MRFKSPITAFQVLVRSATPAVYDPTGTRITREAITPLTANFAVHRGEYKYMDPITGKEEIGADIAGHMFDSHVAQELEKWTDAERELVEATLLELCDRQPEHISLFEDPAITAPWDTYDATGAARIAELAGEINKVEHALIYERQNKARVTVIAALEEALAAPAAEEAVTEDEDALIATVQ